MKRKKMLETDYRASRLCRVLGNPTAYRVVKALQPNQRKTPSQIACEIGLPRPLVSATLRVLRLADLVRYEARGKARKYWLKAEEIQSITESLEHFVERTRRARL